MDRVNLSSVRAWAPAGYTGDIELLMHYSKRPAQSQVADPYYADEQAFDGVIATLEVAVEQLLDHIGMRYQV